MLSSTMSELRQRWLGSMKNGSRVREVLTKEAPMKTYQQVKMQFGLVVEMVRQRLDDMGADVCGVSPNKNMVYEILKRACFGVGDMGETLGLSEMTTEQYSRAFENCRTWAATQLELDIPDPDPQWRNRSISEKKETET